MAEYSKQIADLLVYHCNNQGYKFDFDADKGVLSMRFKIKGKLSALQFRIRVKNSFYVSYAYIDMHCDEAQRVEVAKYLTMANYGLYCGNFETDLNDGEIRYKYLVDCSYCMPSKDMIESSLDTPIAMFERYGDELLKIMFGMQTAEEGIKIAEGQS